VQQLTQPCHAPQTCRKRSISPYALQLLVQDLNQVIQQLEDLETLFDQLLIESNQSSSISVQRKDE
jgi:hypothetical protein